MSFQIVDRGRLEAYVARRLDSLQSGYLRDRSSAKALLAGLRKASSKEPGELTDTWEFEFGGIPESLVGKGDSPATEGEWATHLVFTLYAIHQQSKHEKMYRQTKEVEGVWFGLGHAAKRFASLKDERRQEDLEQGEMPRRFAALVTANDIREAGHYARQFVRQLRNADIPLDYGHLAGQLYAFQFPYLKRRVALEWAREFSRWTMPTEPVNQADDTMVSRNNAKA